MLPPTYRVRYLEKVVATMLSAYLATGEMLLQCCLSTCRVRYLEEVVAEHSETLASVDSIERQLDRIYTELDTEAPQGSGGVAKTQTLPTTGSGCVAETEAPPTTDTEVVVITDQAANHPTTELMSTVGRIQPSPTEMAKTGTLSTRGSEEDTVAAVAPPTLESDTEATPAVAAKIHLRNKALLSRMSKSEVSEYQPRTR